MHQFPTNFYGNTMAVMVLGYIRPELDYISKGTHSPFGPLRHSHLLLQRH